MIIVPRALLIVAALFGFAGCKGEPDGSAGKSVVTGKLVENGQPFSLDLSKVPLPKGASAPPPGSGGGGVRVTFISPEGGEQFVAKTDSATGAFEVVGTDGKGIKPGSYKIAVTASHGFGPGSPDYFNGKFAPEKTQILRDVKPGEEIIIDVSKPQG